MSMEKPSQAQYYPIQRKRADCLQMLLNWRGATLKDGEVEKIDLAAQDEVSGVKQAHLMFALSFARVTNVNFCFKDIQTFNTIDDCFIS